MKPSIGRIVHFNSGEGPAAALVIKVRNEGSTLDLRRCFTQMAASSTCLLLSLVAT